MSELPLRLPRGHAPPGDPLGRVYTPLALATEIAKYLSRHYFSWPGDGPLAPRTITDGSVGGGALIRAARSFWPGAEYTGVDIDPTAPGLDLVNEGIVGDWTANQPWDVDDLGIGNPPFGKAVKMEVTCRHVVASIERSLLTALILPTPTLGSVKFHKLVLDRYPLHAYVPILPRPWNRVRECGLFVWWTIRDTRTGTQVIKRVAGLPVMHPPIRWKRER